MSYLNQQSLNFHRFSDEKLPVNEKKNPLNNREFASDSHTQSIWTTNTSLDYSIIDSSINRSATTRTNGDSIDKNDKIKLYSSCSIDNNSSYSSNAANITQYNGSTLKLIQVQKKEYDNSCKQSRCSIFRGTVLCLCMNLTYANIVRFPRELERHGIAFLVPYLLIMFIIGVPIVMLEIALGQFLGQGAAQSWKSSPFFKGASVVGHIGAWIGCIWISMHLSLSLLYIGQISFSGVPFRQCPSTVNIEEHYQETGVPAQLCLQKTFLRSFRESTLSFGLLAVGLVFLWVIVMLSTHSSRVNRRSIMMFGWSTFGLLLFQLGWQIKNTVEQERLFPQIWTFDNGVLNQSSTWFYALIQVIFSTQIGIGAIPVMTGKFLYKGDAVRLCCVYICFNFLVTIIATAYFMTPYRLYKMSYDDTRMYPDLTIISSIYDRTFNEPHSTYLRKLIPSLAYLMIIFSGIVSISIAIYTSSRLFKRHPNYIMCLAGLCLGIGFLLYPHFTLGKYLDMRWTGLIIVCALIFEIISITWIYGIKELSVDLEFSIGRPIMKFWLIIWSYIPLMLVLIIACFIVFPTNSTSIEPIIDFIPKWIPIAICLSIVICFGIYEVTKQVDYNIFNMFYEATKSAKDWGPADPLVRHAWKQWKTVYDDTGQRDFTLKRRGTKDWTSSIKKGQYSHAKRNTSSNCIPTLNNNNNKYIVNKTQIFASTASNSIGSNSPNYNGSIFGDSAIEEDISCGDKYSSNERGRNSRQFNYDQSDPKNNRYHQSTSNPDYDTNGPITTNYQRIPIKISTINDNPKVKRNSYFQTNDEIIITDDSNSSNVHTKMISTDFSNHIFPPPAQFQAHATYVKNPLCQLNYRNTAFDSSDQEDKMSNMSLKKFNQQIHLDRNLQINNMNRGENTYNTFSVETMSAKTSSSNNSNQFVSGFSTNWKRRSYEDEYFTEL